jgi:hypothetical protein
MEAKHLGCYIQICVVRKIVVLKLTFQSNLVHRSSRSEFVVSVNKYLEAKNHKMSVGMRFKMRFKGDESPERRYSTFYIPYKFIFCHRFQWCAYHNILP